MNVRLLPNENQRTGVRWRGYPPKDGREATSRLRHRFAPRVTRGRTSQARGDRAQAVVSLSAALVFSSE